jgi:hypothetical protein
MNYSAEIEQLRKDILDLTINIKKKQAIIKTLKCKEPKFFPFVENSKCVDTCQGWNGINNLCECGNTQVEWDYDYLEDELEPCATNFKSID